MLFCPFLPDIPQNITLFKVSQSSPAFLSDNIRIKMKMIWSVGGMVLTGKSRNTRTETCPSAFLSTTNLTLPVPGPIPGHRSERPRNEGLNYKNQVPTSNRTHFMSITKTSRLILFWEIIALYRENRRTYEKRRYIQDLSKEHLHISRPVAAFKVYPEQVVRVTCIASPLRCGKMKCCCSL